MELPEQRELRNRLRAHGRQLGDRRRPDGEQAIRDIANVKPHAVVLDVMMPRKDGFEVLKATRANPDFADLPIIMLTAKGQAADKEKALSIGATDFITKPFSNTDVVESVISLAEDYISKLSD